jgi:hypothetical protein
MTPEQEELINSQADMVCSWRSVAAIAQVLLQQHQELDEQADMIRGIMGLTDCGPVPIKPPQQERDWLDHGDASPCAAEAPDLEADARAYHADIFSSLLPKLPTLGGGWTPQRWLKQIAHEGRKGHAHTRAREADQIADWIDRVVAAASPPPLTREEDEQNQRDHNGGYTIAEEEKQNDSEGDSRSRGVRVRDELEEIAFPFVGQTFGSQELINRILDTLIERSKSGGYIYVRTFLDAVKRGI